MKAKIETSKILINPRSGVCFDGAALFSSLVRVFVENVGLNWPNEREKKKNSSKK